LNTQQAIALPNSGRLPSNGLVHLLLPSEDHWCCVDFLEIEVDSVDQFLFGGHGISRNMVRATLLKRFSTRFNHEPCLGYEHELKSALAICRQFQVSKYSQPYNAANCDVKRITGGFALRQE
jgi:hypothetical protein